MNNFGAIQAPYGRFYSGMTLREAKENGTDKSFWRRDFHNLDKNKDGVLSVNEIMKERKRESLIDKITAGVFTVLGAHDLINSRNSKWKWFWLAIDGYIAVSSILRANRIDRENKEIEKHFASIRRPNRTIMNA